MPDETPAAFGGLAHYVHHCRHAGEPEGESIVLVDQRVTSTSPPRRSNARLLELLAVRTDARVVVIIMVTPGVRRSRCVTVLQSDDGRLFCAENGRGMELRQRGEIGEMCATDMQVLHPMVPDVLSGREPWNRWEGAVDGEP